MKKSLRHYFSNCILLLLLFHFSDAQIKTTPVKYNEKANPNIEVRTLRSALISCKEAEEMADQIQTGKWIAITGTGFAFEFVVNEDATSITQLKIIFTDWKCGSATHNGSVTSISNWNINNNGFVINRKDYITNEEFTITGTFGSSGNQASGDWSYKSSSGNCDGNWTAIPEGGIIQLPDLVVTASNFVPSTGTIGTNLNIQTVVKNIGSGSADTSTVAFYLCVDPGDMSKDIFIGSAKVQSLKANDETGVEINYEISSDIPVGSYYIGYTVDLYNNLEESDEKNDFYSSSSQFTRLADPELIVSNKISDIVLYIDSIDFAFNLEAPPAVFYYSNPDVVLSYSIYSSNGSIASASILGSIITVSPVSEGLATITVSADDGKGGTISTDFNVEVKIQKEESVLPFGGCLVLDGSDDYAEAFDHSELDLGDESSESITVEAWVNFSEFSSSDIIVKPDAYRLYTEAYTSMGYQFRAIGFNLRSGITTSIVASGTTIYGGGLWNEGWHHVAGVYNKSSGKMSLYMDGERLHEKYYGDIEANNSDQALTVGANFDGMIDEIRISDCARYADTVYIVPNEPFSDDECTRALWHFDEPLESLECHDCCKEDNCLFLFKGAFVTSIESFDEKVLDHFELFKNYPNPFSVSTTIEFNVLKASRLQIRIYDILGREVKTLVDGKYLPGTYQIIWNGKNMEGLDSGSGIYLIKMQSGEFIRVKKVLLKRY
jgi:hypothetical protein